MVNWSEFEKLSGSQEYNFEMLCRSLVWTHYGRYGQFRALANQPGVEFHLNLQTDCSLGKAGDWFGWQCRWYSIPTGKALGSTRREKIKDALTKTIATLPNVTDWVLWTRHTLTKSDQDWFYALNSKIRLHLWTSSDVERLLSGDAEIFKQTYFGDLILTPERLNRIHETSIAPIKMRWLPEVHQPVDAERELRKMLAQSQSWDELQIVAQNLLQATVLIRADPKALSEPLLSTTTPFLQTAELLADILSDVHLLIEKGDLELLRQRLNTRLKEVQTDAKCAPRKLRNARLICGLYATNALADITLGIELLDQVDSFLGRRLIGVLADAGGGKTHLAAELTAGSEEKPAGILLLGRFLNASKTLDDLAKGITINGHPVQSMPALLAALNAAGQRAKCRLALVIDGLNEAEDPRNWKPLLASLDSQLKGYANVLVICTLRTGARQQTDHHYWHRPTDEEVATRMTFADQALPEDVGRIEIPDFGEDATDAILKYFNFFRIKGSDADIPFELLKHPLTLRIFCEVTNPSRKNEVGVEEMPRSLTAMFERYLNYASERIAEIAPSTNRYYQQDINRVLNVLGLKLWEIHSREVAEDDFRKQIGDEAQLWDNSIVRLLEQEGVILRTLGTLAGQQNIIPVYDLLGGYLIANALVSYHGNHGLGEWLNNEETIKSLGGDYPDRHPLADDIFRALVGLVPQRLNGKQLWQLVNEPLRTSALGLVTKLEGKYIDAETVSVVHDEMKKQGPSSQRFFDGLFNTRSAKGHPFNALFLDSVLESMDIDERDLKWTEWVRENREWLLDDVQLWTERWKEDLVTRTPANSLRATWFMWLLTTTVHKLRDQATRALYWFGRGDADALFTHTKRAAAINDPYVFERMLAASYGVAMALAAEPKQTDFRNKILPQQARQLYNLIFKEDKPFQTTHALTRDYGSHFLELAALHNPTLFLPEELSRIHTPYTNDGSIEWQKVKATKKSDSWVDTPLRMDFENYTLGGLVKNRHPYDNKHTEYRKVRAQILWRVKQLGWSATAFEEVDKRIEAQRKGYNRHDDREYDKIDRYGKKYSWIAYFELHGWRQDRGLLRDDLDGTGRSWEIDIDPSFPSPVRAYKLIDLDFLGEPDIPLSDWIKKGQQPDFSPYFTLSEMQGEEGPWVLLDGFITQQDEKRGRSMFAFVRSLLVSKDELNKLLPLINKQRLSGRWLPEKPYLQYTFSGEVPWCNSFPKISYTTLEFVTGEEKVIVEQEQPLFFLDGEQIENSSFITLLQKIPQLSGLLTDDLNLSKEEIERIECLYQTVEVEGTKRTFCEIEVLIPVCDMSLAGRPVETEGNSSRVVLSRELTEVLGLTNIPQTHDLQTPDGKRATLQFNFRPESYNNSQHFFFIRKDILEECLDKLGLSLVWAVWGERDLSLGQFKRRETNHDFAEDPMRKNFESIHAYKPTQSSVSKPASIRKNKSNH